MRKTLPLIFEQQDGCNAYTVQPHTRSVDPAGCIPQALLRQRPPQLPNVSEPTLVRHYSMLAAHQRGVDQVCYPLGSCTMKYNPKIDEAVSALPGFANAHPLLEACDAQGCLQAMYCLQQCLCSIFGMDAFTLQPAAGAHGEFTGLLIIRAAHEAHGQMQRTQILVPDASHGTNPASASMAGFTAVEIASRADGRVDLDALRAAVSDRTAGLMLTNPSTLGLFEADILEIADIVHGAGGYLYYDGANMNAIMGVCRPGDMGFDVVHSNLHKTFATPHGGGGPGSGPIGVKEELRAFLPKPQIVQSEDGMYRWDADCPQSIGQVKAFYGNFGVCLKALAYILSLGGEGIRAAAQDAVLNANYLMHALKGTYTLPYEAACMHEFVLSAANLPNGVHATDVAKALIDAGVHPPTVYFPLIVKEAMMFEPTETETRATLDALIATMKDIAQRAQTAPETLKAAPHTTPVGRLDEVQAARKPRLVYTYEA